MICGSRGRSRDRVLGSDQTASNCTSAPVLLGPSLLRIAPLILSILSLCSRVFNNNIITVRRIFCLPVRNGRCFFFTYFEAGEKSRILRTYAHLITGAPPGHRQRTNVSNRMTERKSCMILYRVPTRIEVLGHVSRILFVEFLFCSYSKLTVPTAIVWTPHPNFKFSI